MIETNDVSVAIGVTQILRDINMSAARGQVTTIVGPNGSGKSTLLKAITGELGYSGNIAINGTSLSAMKPWQLATIRGVLPQSTSLSFPFTVREVISLGMSHGRSGLSAMEEANLPEQALARVDLGGFAGRFYQQLSGGEQQRVQLARVLCQIWTPVIDGRPRWLLLDEPISSLDIRHQLMIMNIARDFARQGGGVLAILHDLNLTAMYADRVVVMSRGRVAAQGLPTDVLNDRVISDVFECDLKVGVLPPPGTPFILPQTAGGSLS